MFELEVPFISVLSLALVLLALALGCLADLQKLADSYVINQKMF